MSIKQEAEGYLQIALDNPNAFFHDGQWESISELLDGNRALVIQRTGWVYNAKAIIGQPCPLKQMKLIKHPPVQTLSFLPNWTILIENVSHVFPST